MPVARSCSRAPLLSFNTACSFTSLPVPASAVAVGLGVGWEAACFIHRLRCSVKIFALCLPLWSSQFLLSVASSEFPPRLTQTLTTMRCKKKKRKSSSGLEIFPFFFTGSRLQSQSWLSGSSAVLRHFMMWFCWVRTRCTSQHVDSTEGKMSSSVLWRSSYLMLP